MHLCCSAGIRGFMLGFLGEYPLSSPSPTAIHLYLLSCWPLGSLPRLSSPTPFQVFFCLHRLPCGFALALLFHRFLWDFQLQLSFTFVRLLALGAYDLLIFLLYRTLFPLLSLLIVCGFSSSSSSFTASFFLVASCRSVYRRIVFYVCGLSRVSWTSLLLLLLSGLFRVFSLPMRHDLIPSILLFVWACELGSGAFLFPPAFLPCRCLSDSSLSVAYHLCS